MIYNGHILASIYVALSTAKHLQCESNGGSTNLSAPRHRAAPCEHIGHIHGLVGRRFL